MGCNILLQGSSKSLCLSSPKCTITQASCQQVLIWLLWARNDWRVSEDKRFYLRLMAGLGGAVVRCCRCSLALFVRGGLDLLSWYKI